jgi:hypothetical protein
MIGNDLKCCELEFGDGSVNFSKAIGTSLSMRYYDNWAEVSGLAFDI